MIPDSLKQKVDEEFPFDEYYELQDEALYEAAEALLIDDYQNVVLDLPTGIGKSGINVALLNLLGGGFYTTPLKDLRKQLEVDEDLKSEYEILRGRADYQCSVKGTDCAKCPIYNQNGEKCRDYDCTYWNAKTRNMKADSSVITFSYLIIDDNIPTYTETGEQISFANRPAVVVDEIQDMISQVVNMHAGYSVSPWSVPTKLFSDLTNDLDMNANRYEDVSHIVDELYDRCLDFVNENKDVEIETVQDEVDQCKSFMDRVTYMRSEISEGRQWVVDTDVTNHPGLSGKTKKFDVKPIKIDRFLNKFIWSRGEKRILSTATMRDREDPEKFCERLGLDWENTKVVSKESPFHKRNRPIVTETMIDEFSSGGDEENWTNIMAHLNTLCGWHDGQKGVVHSASYDRAAKVYHSASDWDNLRDNIVLDIRDNDTSEMIDEWQNSDKDIIVSPNMTQGVDLKHEMCRWQALLKVPFPSPADSRVEYKLDVENAWDWYMEETCIDIIQSAGRAVRAPDDYAVMYILDESAKKVFRRAGVPEWFKESFVTPGDVWQMTQAEVKFEQVFGDGGDEEIEDNGFDVDEWEAEVPK